MNQNGIIAGCGCSPYSSTVPLSQAVQVNSQNFSLIYPPVGEFNASNPQFGYYVQNTSSTATLNVKLASGHFWDHQHINVGAGTATYTGTFTLDYINANIGAFLEFNLYFPASNNPTISFVDRYSSTNLLTVPSTGNAFNVLIRFVWTGSIWEQVEISYPQTGQPPNISGSISIPSGASSVAVSVNLPSTGLPIFVTVQNPTGGYVIAGSVDIGSITTSGFTVDLTGETPTTGYNLSYLIIV